MSESIDNQLDQTFEALVSLLNRQAEEKAAEQARIDKAAQTRATLAALLAGQPVAAPVATPSPAVPATPTAPVPAPAVTMQPATTPIPTAPPVAVPPAASKWAIGPKELPEGATPWAIPGGNSEVEGYFFNGVVYLVGSKRTVTAPESYARSDGKAIEAGIEMANGKASAKSGGRFKTALTNMGFGN